MEKRLNIAKNLTLLENKKEGWKELYAKLLKFDWGLKTIVFAGPPGVGKSSILNYFVEKCNDKTTFLLIDPSSSISGGAVLADRARFKSKNNSEKPFIRSIASRGHHGGTSFSIWPFLRLFNSEKFEQAFVESVGVGQTSQELRGIADFLIVVLSPESGDSYQAVKAGLLDEADLIVINKYDREGAERLKSTMETITKKEVLNISAKTNKNIDKLESKIKESQTRNDQDKNIAETKDFATSLFLEKLNKKIKKEKKLNPLDFEIDI